ncbi:small GTP-binding protein, putative [Trichomonas vaginalis G3]|uniref:Ras-related protein Rab-7b n=2 Tax=Trichomonas vaginalis TaxID=5722 RepID=A0A8U0WPP2_TRIV3|nr:small Rab GTPase Rab7b [Trichomonas vaginalis G3]AAX97454.1 small Rab GTPase Rab7b [Trichomonas vaginalis]EAY16547.1 small GTP-binding protein, putative [Trichomonas vaginalis G3]KAI5493539.1 small Rab GTPase Rab7b [Trichomonas vaginalis G3]|eukprot:XP_001328770.1 small GTP-binding protein [Trichomonas vaginalis G3]
MSQDAKTKTFKVVVLGDTGVGKTTLIHQFVNGEFIADFKATIGADFSSKIMTVDGQRIYIQIWDTAGQERFHAVGATFYRGTDACILVYDCTQVESFHRLSFWREDLFTKSQMEPDPKFPIIIFSNKSDLESQKQVNIEDARQWAEQNGYPLFEVSAKSGANVQDGFLKIIEIYLANSKDPNNRPQITLKLTDTKQDKKPCC